MMSEAKREAFQDGFKVGVDNVGAEDLTSIPMDRVYLWSSNKAMQTREFSEVPEALQSSWLHGYTSGARSIAYRLHGGQEPADEPAVVEADAEARAEPEASTSDSAAPRTWQGIARHLVNQIGSAAMLAEAVGVSQATVYGWLKGNKPHTKSRAWLADQVGLEVEDIESGSRKRLGRELEQQLSDLREDAELLHDEVEELVTLLVESTRLLHQAIFEPAKLNKEELSTWSCAVCGYLEAREETEDSEA